MLNLRYLESQISQIENIIKHTEAALWDQVHLLQQTDSVAQISAYKKSRSNASKLYSGCGTTNHTNSQCSTVCPAWGNNA